MIVYLELTSEALGRKRIEVEDENCYVPKDLVDVATMAMEELVIRTQTPMPNIYSSSEKNGS